jgi:hypothetical protein
MHRAPKMQEEDGGADATKTQKRQDLIWLEEASQVTAAPRK